MARNAVRNISKLIIGFIWHVIIIELFIRLKWMVQHMRAVSLGYESHAKYLQTHLDMRIKVYEAQKGNIVYA